MYIYILITIK